MFGLRNACLGCVMHNAEGYTENYTVYNRFRVSGFDCTLPTATIDVTTVLEQFILMCYTTPHETLPFHYCNHIIDCSAQGTIGTRNPVTSVCTYVRTVVCSISCFDDFITHL